MDKFPLEIATQILGRLPTTYCVLHNKSICGNWRAILNNTKFGLLFCITSRWGNDFGSRLIYIEHMNTELYNTIVANSHPDDGPLKRLSHPVIGSCNGLVCFYVYHDNIQDPVYIINPEISQYIHLSQKYMLPEECVGRRNMLGGFGYCRSSDQYKVVRIDPDEKVEVNTLGDKMGWRNVEHISVCFCGGESGVYVNGCIFCLVYKDAIKALLSFNLRSETFSTHSLPPNHKPGGNIHVDQFPAVGMMLFGVTLFVYNMHSQQENRIDFWTLDENNKDFATPADEPGHLIWRRRFNINLPKQKNDWLTYNPFALGNNNDILLWDNRCILRYDTSTRTFREIWGTIPFGTCINIVPHMKNNVFLEDFGAVSEMCGD